MINEKISYKNNTCTSPVGATHIHSNGDLYKMCDKHEFGSWLNYNPAVGFWTKSMLRTENENSVLSAIEEKPKPTKFVKVEESIFDLKGEFERGELYSSDCEGHYTQLKCEKRLYLAAHQDSVYRQVEIDWRDEVAEFTGLGKDFYTWVDCIDDMYNFNFVEMCHLVASLTEKPANG